ncbi:MAG: hypothetical protein Kow00121_45350 [Elainellaceae cyanobacterium]
MVKITNLIKPAQPAIQIGVVALTGGVLLLIQSVAVAQTGGNAPSTAGASDIRSNSTEDGLNMFDLIHEAQQGPIRNPYDFWQDQQENLSEEAVQFRDRQRNAIEQRQPGAQPITPAPTESQPLEP